jgi:hypothetical protein
MSNWFKTSQEAMPGEVQPEPVLSGGDNGGDAVRYRLVFPIDILAFTTGNPEQDQETVYNIIRSILDKGQAASKDMPGFEGFSDYLQLSDVKPHGQVTEEDGLGGFGR